MRTIDLNAKVSIPQLLELQDAAMPPPSATPAMNGMNVADKSSDDVRFAIQLGWDMADLYRHCKYDLNPAREGSPRRLPGISDLDRRAAVGLAIRQLSGPISRLDAVDPAQLVGLETTWTNAANKFDGLGDQVASVHQEILRTLTASDSTIGKSYDLGTSLSNLCCGPLPGQTDVNQRATANELLRLHDHVRDLNTVLPAHVGQAVQESMARWQTYLDLGLTKRFGSGKVAGRTELESLQRQGLRWRAVLTGEKRAEDTLSMEQFLKASRSGLRRLRDEIGRVLVAVWPLLLVLAIAAASVIIVAVNNASGTAKSTTTLATLTAAVGAGWRVVKKPLLVSIQRMQQSVTGAEIDLAVAEAITSLPTNAAVGRVNNMARRHVKTATPVAADDPAAPGG
jgi:hypothetical protein